VTIRLVTSKDRIFLTKTSDPVANVNFFGRLGAYDPTIRADENHCWVMEKAELYCGDL
jgi:hypothetical protein